tara:strand:- start:161 stop:457 length:297 start_codon:yes stop_codon:yes gene_type:complete
VGPPYLEHPVKLSFPNPSRNFDATKNRVQFWGYLQSFEISFYVDAAILMKLQPGSENNKEGILSAFDAFAEKIRTIADAEYLRSKSRASSYNLPVSAF